jgi:hypothetical protein
MCRDRIVSIQYALRQTPGRNPVTTVLPFELLDGHVPQLISLSVLISSQKYHNMQDPTRTVLVFEMFLRSVPALEILRLTWNYIPECLLMVLHLQGRTLRELDLYYDCSVDPWNRSVLMYSPKHQSFLTSELEP